MENKPRIFKSGKALSKATKKKTTVDQQAETYLNIRNLAFESFATANSPLEKLLPDSGSESKKEFSRRLKSLDSSLSMDELRARVTKAEMLVEWYHHHLLIDKKFTALYKEAADAQFEKQLLATPLRQKNRYSHLDEAKIKATEVFEESSHENLINLKTFLAEMKTSGVIESTLKSWFKKLRNGERITKISDKK
jgi:hypothetical protein